MKLVQLNTWGGRVENSLRRFIQTEKPDIFCMQEIISYKHGDPIIFMPIEHIQTIGNLEYRVFGASNSFKFMKDRAYFGNAILSNKEITKSEVIFTNLEYVEDFSYEEHDYNVRNLVHATIEHNGQQINILTHHGFHVPENKDGNVDTERQIDQIADYIQSLDGHIILTGDFNLKPTSKSLGRLNKLLSNLSIDYKLKTTRNELTHKTEVCDYIFISSDIKINDFRASLEIISDHQALILDFDI